MEDLWGNGTREDLVRLGGMLDRGGDDALHLTGKALKIRNKMGQNVDLRANRAQLAYAERARQRNIVLKARQMGVTTWIAGWFFLKTITHPGTVTVEVAHTQEAAEAIFRIVHRFLANLPEPLREGALKSAKATARRIAIPALDSEYMIETAGDRNAGRGLTITNLHCTELARWPGDPAETLCGLRATLSPWGELVMESTPMGASGCFWQEWKDADRTGTVRHFFPWWLEEAYAAEPVAEPSLTGTERQLMEKYGLSPEKIGYRRQLQETFRGLAKQEYAEDATECFLASGECVFETAAIDARLREVIDPAEVRRRGELRIWLPPQKGRRYLVALDPAGGGTQGDYTAAQVLDLETGFQCAELQAHLTPFEAAQEAAALAREYGNALLVVERNNHGAGVLAYLDGVLRYEHLYRADDGKDGWLTSTRTRRPMIGKLGAALVDSPQLFASERLLRECRSFVRQVNGEPGAQAGEHDDCVLAMAIALAVRDERLTRLQ